MEAASTSETSAIYQTTRRKNPEDGHLLTMILIAEDTEDTVWVKLIPKARQVEDRIFCRTLSF
jgi:hypothetical protein